MGMAIRTVAGLWDSAVSGEHTYKKSENSHKLHSAARDD